MKKFSFRILIVMLLDAVVLTVAGGAALLLRFEFSFDSIPTEYLEEWFAHLPLEIAVFYIVFLFCRMYRFVWRSISAVDVAKMVGTSSLAWVASHAVLLLLGVRRPISTLVIQYIIALCGLVGMRCVLRFWSEFTKYFERRSRTDCANVMLIGAGEAGVLLAREIKNNQLVHAKVCCFIDDNSQKVGKYLEGVPIVGGRDAIQQMAVHYAIDKIILTMPTVSQEQKSEILNLCKETGCKLQILPNVYDLVNGRVSMASVKDVQVEDLLGREPVQLNMEKIHWLIEGQTVLVTGGGGSIGSELCRQIAGHAPRRLILIDIYENNAYDIQQELKRQYGDALLLNVEIASVRDKEKMFELFERYRPDLVFHAAAHKHVPLMEDCPSEAIKNNIFGTYNVVCAAEKYGVKKFVLISTDKAVNPTNVMGASKRFCEMILQSRHESSTVFCAVRFGNVLGSNGSVVPLFKKQIEAGGPVTITDKRITRFFMTIPEAVQLVMEAGAMADRNQIFVLDMGKPVSILTMAENLIRLSGLVPYFDIDIKEIGLRPGEKLYEELLMSSETLSSTENRKIFVEEQSEIAPEELNRKLSALDHALDVEASREALIDLMHQLIPTYQSPDEVNAREIRRREAESGAGGGTSARQEKTVVAVAAHG